MISIQGEIHSSKNSRQIFKNRRTGVPFVAKSQRSKEDERSFALQLATLRQQWAWLLNRHYEAGGVRFEPLKIVFRFRRRTAARFDYVNLAQGLLDAMVKAEYIVDDSANYVLPVFVPYVIDRDNPGCDIWLQV